MGSVLVAYRLSWPAVSGIFPNQGWNSCPCTDRWILNYWTTSQVQMCGFIHVCSSIWNVEEHWTPSPCTETWNLLMASNLRLYRDQFMCFPSLRDHSLAWSVFQCLMIFFVSSLLKRINSDLLNKSRCLLLYLITLIVIKLFTKTSNDLFSACAYVVMYL